MNGPQRFPLVHRQAFGHAALFGSRIKERQISLGQPPGPTMSEAELKYQEKKTHYEGVQKNYENLVALLGKEDADRTLAEAKMAYEEALVEWDASKGGVQA